MTPIERAFRSTCPKGQQPVLNRRMAYFGQYPDLAFRPYRQAALDRHTAAAVHFLIGKRWRDSYACKWLPSVISSLTIPTSIPTTRKNPPA
jgi:hypothetical protein